MTQLERITAAHERLQQMRPLSAEARAELNHLFEVRLTHHSTAIEGNTLTQSETQIVIEKGVTIAGKSIREHLEVVGHKEALDFVLNLAEANEPITERVIREIHSLVMKGQSEAEVGTFRTIDVRAAGTEFVYPSHLKVGELMSEFCAWLSSNLELHPVLLASEAHLRFVTIHPFRDGNGRVGRLLMNLILVRGAYPICVIPVTRRAEYIDSLVSAQRELGRESLDELVMDGVEEGFRAYGVEV